MRHGEAGEARTDPERPLTPRGRAQAKASATGLKALGVAVPRIWCSPYVRARQTAEIVGAVLGVDVVEDARFVPGASAERAVEAVYGAKDGVLVVAHMPILPAIIEVVCGGRVSFSTASVAHVVVAAASAHAPLGAGTGFLSGLFSSDFLEHVR